MGTGHIPVTEQCTTNVHIEARIRCLLVQQDLKLLLQEYPCHWRPLVVPDLRWMERYFVSSSPIALTVTSIYVHSAVDYIYVLLWNSVWTIAPVIGIGLFDRILGNIRYLCINGGPSDSWTDARLLMDLPELYHYGRRGSWFNLKSFFIYMLDGFVQVRRIRDHRYCQSSNLHMSRLRLSISSFFTRTSHRHLARMAMTCTFMSSRRYCPSLRNYGPVLNFGSDYDDICRYDCRHIYRI
jgi:Phospholipid-translocating P-type ATPase C-terminal